jgi:hypothetical protein
MPVTEDVSLGHPDEEANEKGKRRRKGKRRGEGRRKINETLLTLSLTPIPTLFFSLTLPTHRTPKPRQRQKPRARIQERHRDVLRGMDGCDIRDEFCVVGVSAG